MLNCRMLTNRRMSLMLGAVVLAAACTGTTSDSTARVPTPTETSTPGASDPTTGTASGGDAETDADPQTSAVPTPASELEIVAYPVPGGSRPHDVAPAADGGVWYTAQGSGELGWLDPSSGETRHIALGPGSRPHGVIVDRDGTPWITDGGLNAIVAVDPATDEVTVHPLPPDRPNANLNTAAFDRAGRLWFTGQNGIHGVLDPGTEAMEVFDSPQGRGPYGIAATPSGEIYFASLAGSYIGAVDSGGDVTVLEPPTPEQGARRVWSDSVGSLWVSEWNSGQLSRYVPSTGTWTTWPLPGQAASAYAVYVDDVDSVWVTDFGGNAIHRFDPSSEAFDTFALPSSPGDVRQLLGRRGEVWGAESAADQLVVIRAAEVTELSLTPTATQQEGPYYPVAKLDDRDTDLTTVDGVAGTASGQVLVLGGRLLTTTAQPIAGAMVEIWQTDVNGIYLHPDDPAGDDRDPRFQSYGEAVTSADGSWEFRTIDPGYYEPRPRHVHVKVRIDDVEVLTTQIYFSDDPTATGLDPTLLAATETDRDGELHADTDLVIDLG